MSEKSKRIIILRIYEAVTKRLNFLNIYDSILDTDIVIYDKMMPDPNDTVSML